MKLVELPAEIYNDFKVGDNIRIYELGTHYNSVVESVEGNFVKTTLQIHNCLAGIGMYHYKQCRKLAELKPREFYVNVEHFQIQSFENNSRPEGKNWIKVREVEE